jgi:hypothetical protein
MTLETSEVRRILEFWVGPTSRLNAITLVTSSERINGTAKALDGDVVIIATTDGERRVAITEVENLLLHQQSDPPE